MPENLDDEAGLVPIAYRLIVVSDKRIAVINRANHEQFNPVSAGVDAIPAFQSSLELSGAYGQVNRIGVLWDFLLGEFLPWKQRVTLVRTAFPDPISEPELVFDQLAIVQPDDRFRVDADVKPGPSAGVLKEYVAEDVTGRFAVNRAPSEWAAYFYPHRDPWTLVRDVGMPIEFIAVFGR
jgi:hypothetical protein